MRVLRLFTGPMFSGKTSRLITTVEEQRELFDRVVVIKHAVDRRFPGHSVRSHTGLTLDDAVSMPTLDDVPVASRTLVAVDEGQFFGDSLVRLFHRIADSDGASLVVAGLDLDFRRREFGAILTLAREALSAAVPVEIHKLTAKCALCTHPAPFTQRLTAGGDAQVVVGGNDLYRPACAHHHEPRPIPADVWERKGGRDRPSAGLPERS